MTPKISKIFNIPPKKRSMLLKRYKIITNTPKNRTPYEIKMAF